MIFKKWWFWSFLILIVFEAIGYYFFLAEAIDDLFLNEKNAIASMELLQIFCVIPCMYCLNSTRNSPH